MPWLPGPACLKAADRLHDRRPVASPVSIVPSVLQIVEATEVDDSLLGALQRLLPQLSRSSEVPDASELAEITAAPATRLLIAVGDDGEVLGMLTLALFRIPTGVRAWIEDVVVDARARGRGAGEALTQRALELASAAGARTVELTSRPSREAANRLYRRMGFEQRDTNVYRYELGERADPRGA